MKTFNLTTNVGKAKYVVSYHNGIKHHKDGSPFFDISIFHNKKKMKQFKNILKSDGYIESYI